ncbi:CLUMA_CG019335, isoform A [Clunio marinus]|uniref:CLUMA_CG019335, isoform A n=1 Tax=Clunio marinus TaxID=568069 RepID=A0A1J1J139_9DIPT|nr:CLUMA_CG019335, isoform A [Clunio marinus]
MFGEKVLVKKAKQTRRIEMHNVNKICSGSSNIIVKLRKAINLFTTLIVVANAKCLLPSCEDHNRNNYMMISLNNKTIVVFTIPGGDPQNSRKKDFRTRVQVRNI